MAGSNDTSKPLTPVLPELSQHDHPDNHTHYWSETEMRFIRAYAEKSVLAYRQRVLDYMWSEHHHRKHIDNHAAFYANNIAEIK